MILPPIAVIAVLMSLPLNRGGLGPIAVTADAGVAADSGTLDASTLAGSLWAAGPDAGRYDWAARNVLDANTHAVFAIDLTMPASNLANEGTIIQRDSSSSIQRQVIVSISATGQVVTRIGTTLTGTWAQCNSPSSTLATSTRTRVLIAYDGTGATNAGRLRVWTATVTPTGRVAAPVARTCSFTGTMPAAMTTPTTAPWSIGQTFGSANPLRGVILREIAIWSGVAVDATDSLIEVARARDWTATSLGTPGARYTFDGSTVTEAIAAGAGGLTGQAPTSTTGLQTTHTWSPSLTAGCGLAANSATATISETWAMSVNGVSRSSIVVTPGNYSPTTNYPVIVFLHGCSYTAATLRTEALAGTWDVETSAGRSRAIYVYANGLAGPKGDSYECPISSQTGWTVTQSDSNRDVLYMRGLLTSLRTRFCVNNDRLFLAGRSMGAAGANNIAAWMGPSTWRAVAGAVVAGAPSPTPTAPNWALMTGNTLDPTAPITLARSASGAWSLANGGCISTGTSTTYTDCTLYSCPSGGLRYCESTSGADHTPRPYVGEATRDWFILRGL